MSYPLDRTGRIVARAKARESLMAFAEKQARRAGASLNCAEGEHAPGGCSNDGSGCLCACHDPEAS